MNKSTLIPLSALVTAGTISLADLQEKHSLPATNAWVGLGVVFIAISIINDMGFSGIGLFAVLVMVTTIITRGVSAFGYLGTKTKAPKAARKSGKQPQAAPVTATETATT